jgi:hypothetical protein
MDDMDGITVHGNIAFVTFIRVGMSGLCINENVLFLLSEWEINDIINVGYFSQSVREIFVKGKMVCRKRHQIMITCLRQLRANTRDCSSL